MDNSIVALAARKATDSYDVLAGEQDLPIMSESLFGNKDVVFIQHQGYLYRLRRTRNGKLILNK